MRVSATTVWGTAFLAIGILAGQAQQQPPSQQPPPNTSTRPPENNERGLRPLTPEEIAPNLNFYAMDPLYQAGAPLGWATERIGETLDRGVVVMVAAGGLVHLSWRLLDTDPRDVGFNVYRRTTSGETRLTPRPIVATTDFVAAIDPQDPDRGCASAVVNGRELAASAGDVWTGAPLAGYKTIKFFFTSKGQIISGPVQAQNELVWWDGDLLRELHSGGSISKWKGQT